MVAEVQEVRVLREVSIARDINETTLEGWWSFYKQQAGTGPFVTLQRADFSN